MKIDITDPQQNQVLHSVTFGRAEAGHSYLTEGGRRYLVLDVRYCPDHCKYRIIYIHAAKLTEYTPVTAVYGAVNELFCNAFSVREFKINIELV